MHHIDIVLMACCMWCIVDVVGRIVLGHGVEIWLWRMLLRIDGLVAVADLSHCMFAVDNYHYWLRRR